MFGYVCLKQHPIFGVLPHTWSNSQTEWLFKRCLNEMFFSKQECPLKRIDPSPSPVCVATTSEELRSLKQWSWTLTSPQKPGYSRQYRFQIWSVIPGFNIINKLTPKLLHHRESERKYLRYLFCILITQRSPVYKGWGGWKEKTSLIESIWHIRSSQN